MTPGSVEATRPTRRRTRLSAGTFAPDAMGLFRRLTAPLAALLALVVLGEVTDVVPCRDADCGVWILVLGDSAPTS